MNDYAERVGRDQVAMHNSGAVQGRRFVVRVVDAWKRRREAAQQERPALGHDEVSVDGDTRGAAAVRVMGKGRQERGLPTFDRDIAGHDNPSAVDRTGSGDSHARVGAATQRRRRSLRPRTGRCRRTAWGRGRDRGAAGRQGQKNRHRQYGRRAPRPITAPPRTVTSSEGTHETSHHTTTEPHTASLDLLSATSKVVSPSASAVLAPPGTRSRLQRY